MCMLTGINWLNEDLNGLLKRDISLPGMDFWVPSMVRFCLSPIMLASVPRQHWILEEHNLYFTLLLFYSSELHHHRPSVWGAEDQIVLLVYWIRHLTCNLTSAVCCSVWNSAHVHTQVSPTGMFNTPDLPFTSFFPSLSPCSLCFL